MCKIPEGVIFKRENYPLPPPPRKFHYHKRVAEKHPSVYEFYLNPHFIRPCTRQVSVIKFIFTKITNQKSQLIKFLMYRNNWS